MKHPFRIYHLFQLLETYDASFDRIPIDFCMYRYFKANKALGSKDKAFIAETTYGMIRWKGLLDHFCSSPIVWEKRYEIFKKLPYYREKAAKLPLHIAVSFPKSLYTKFASAYGEEEATRLCLACNFRAPTTIRVNLLKTTQKQLMEKLTDQFPMSPGQHSKTAIHLLKKVNFFTLPEFKEGNFEVQDEGSQLLAQLIQAEPGNHILDFCSGSGGKSLAFAPLMEGKGQIYLHDIRPKAIQEAKKRFKRAGIQNAQFLLPDHPQMKKLKKKMDWVLVDAPCSGTGTLRRNPDMKWKFSEEMLTRLVEQQRLIFEQALQFLKPGGKIVYGTCSLLPEENEKQLDYFLATYPIKLVSPPFTSTIREGEMDGFYGAVFTHK